MPYPDREIGQLRSLRCVDLILGPTADGQTTLAMAASFTENDKLSVVIMEAAGQEATCICDRWPEAAERALARLGLDLPASDVEWYATYPAGGIFIYTHPTVKHFNGRWGLPPAEAARYWWMVHNQPLARFILAQFPPAFYGDVPPCHH